MPKARTTITLVLMTLAVTLKAAGRQADVRPMYRLSLPGESWALDLDLSPFNMPPGSDGLPVADSGKYPIYFLTNTNERFSNDGSVYLLTAFRKPEQKSHSFPALLLIKLEPARAPGMAVDFRDHALKNLSKLRLLRGEPKTSEYGEIPVARYAVKLEWDPLTPLDFYPSDVADHVLAAYLVREGVWISIMLSAKDVGEREEKLFYALLDSVRFADTSAPSTSFDYYHRGRVYYLLGDYGKASHVLAEALRLEQKERRLDTHTWRRLVANLIDSYSSSNDFESAKATLDYAVANDPLNPLFQMGLARYYAKQGDVEKTIRYLQLAFQYKNNPGLTLPLPDPKDDPDFERFRKDEKFRKALKELKK